MRNLIFSIYDRKSNLWTEPIVAINENTMKRFVYTKYNQNPVFTKDLSVYIIGSFDIEGSKFTKDDIEENPHMYEIQGIVAGDFVNPMFMDIAIVSIGTVFDICTEISKELQSGSIEPEDIDA